MDEVNICKHKDHIYQESAVRCQDCRGRGNDWGALLTRNRCNGREDSDDGYTHDMDWGIGQAPTDLVVIYDCCWEVRHCQREGRVLKAGVVVRE